MTNVENLNGSDFAAGSVSNDTLTLLNDVTGLSVNLAKGTNTLNLAAGANSFTNVFNVDTVNGTVSDDTLSIANGLYTPNNDMSIDLGAGNDTLNVGVQYASFALHNVEHLVVTGQHDAFYTLTNDQNGLSVDLGAGNTGLSVAAGANTLSLTNVQSVGTNDFAGGTPSSDDTLTLLNDVSGVTVNLQEGNNTLNLAAGTNAITSFNVQHINGSASDDVLTMLNDAGGTTIDLGAGNNTLNLTGFTGGVTVVNVEHVNGSAATDFITDAGVVGTTTITGGGGADFITLDIATDIIRYTDASEILGGHRRRHRQQFRRDPRSVPARQCRWRRRSGSLRSLRRAHRNSWSTAGRGHPDQFRRPAAVANRRQRRRHDRRGRHHRGPQRLHGHPERRQFRGHQPEPRADRHPDFEHLGRRK